MGAASAATVGSNAAVDILQVCVCACLLFCKWRCGSSSGSSGSSSSSSSGGGGGGRTWQRCRCYVAAVLPEMAAPVVALLRNLP